MNIRETPAVHEYVFIDRSAPLARRTTLLKRRKETKREYKVACRVSLAGQGNHHPGIPASIHRAAIRANARPDLILEAPPFPSIPVNSRRFPARLRYESRARSNGAPTIVRHYLHESERSNGNARSIPPAG
jgi:hypothetical protein